MADLNRLGELNNAAVMAIEAKAVPAPEPGQVIVGGAVGVPVGNLNEEGLEVHIFLTKPTEGIMPYQVPPEVHNTRQLRALRDAMNGNLMERRGSLIRKVSRMAGSYYANPANDQWLCLHFYMRSGQMGWQFKNIHCVGLTVMLRAPGCPGLCGRSPMTMFVASDCKACSFILHCHLREIETGEVFKAITQQ